MRLRWNWRTKEITSAVCRGWPNCSRDDPPYVPAFFMAAQQMVAQDQIPEARTMLRDGIEEARRQGDAHAAGEMSELLTQLGARGE